MMFPFHSDLYRIGIFDGEDLIMLFESPSFDVIIDTIKRSLDEGYKVRTNDKVKLKLDEMKRRANQQWN